MAERIAVRQGPIDTLPDQKDRQQQRWRGETSEISSPDVERHIKTRRVGPNDTAIIPRPTEPDPGS